MVDFKGGVDFLAKGGLGKMGGAVFAEVNKGGVAHKRQAREMKPTCYQTQ